MRCFYHGCGILFVVWLLCASPGWSQPSPALETTMRANQLFENREYSSALPLYRQILTGDPNSKTRDEIMLRIARCAYELRRYDEAVTALTSLRQAFPESKAAADGTALLFCAYLAQGDKKQAGVVWQDVFTRLPRTEFALQMVESYCYYMTRVNAAAGLQQLDELVAQKMLPANADWRIKAMRCGLLEVANPAQFLTEAVAVIDAVSLAKTVDEVRLPVMLARRVYLPLMKSGQLQQARSLAAKVQEKLALMGNPNDWYSQDILAYFDALSVAGPARFMEEAKPLLAAAKLAKTPEDLQLPSFLAKRMYAALMQAGNFGEAKALYTEILTICKTVIPPELGEVSLIQENHHTYLRGLSNYNATQFITEAVPFVLEAVNLHANDSIALRAAVATWLYPAMCKYGQADGARAVHQQLAPALKRLGKSAIIALDKEAYLLAMDYVPALVLENTQAVFTELKRAKSPDDLRPIAAFARMAAYKRLQLAKRGDEAAAYHQQLQEALTKFAMRQEIDLDNVGYLQSLADGNPDEFLRIAMPKIARAKDARTLDEFLLPFSLACSAYVPLFDTGRLEEACVLQGEMQAHLKRLGNPDGWSERSTAAYAEAVRKLPIQAFAPIMHQFKCALATGDKAGAEQWLTRLTNYAPQHPQTLRAQAIYRGGTL
ncbi:MAG: tetratricopeptide repeat protein [Armatimonadota bacterium]